MSGPGGPFCLLLGLMTWALHHWGGTPPLRVLHFLVAAILLTLVPGRIILRRLQLEVEPVEEATLSIIVGAVVSSGVYWGFAFLGVPRLFAAWPLGVGALALLEGRRTPPTPTADASPVPWWSLAGLLALGLVPLVLVPIYYRNLVTLPDGGLTFSYLGDALLHLALGNELVLTAPPQNPILPGLSYHYGMDVLVAAFSRGSGLGIPDLSVRFIPSLLAVMTLMAAFCLARTRMAAGWCAVLAALLAVFGEDFSFIPGLWLRSPQPWVVHFFAVPSVVSLYQMNPMLPALALLFAGLFCIVRHLQGIRRGPWLPLACALLTAAAWVKVFATAHVVAALGIAGLLLARRSRDYRLLKAAAACGLLVLPFVIGPWTQGGGGVAARLYAYPYVPGALFRMGLFGFPFWRPVAALFAGEPSVWGLAVFLVLALPAFLVGALGLRILAFPQVLRQLFAQSPDPTLVLFGAFVLLGPLITLTWSVGVPDLPPDKQYNNAVWFFVQSKYLAWFLVAEGLFQMSAPWPAWRRRLVFALSLALALPSTVQYFAFQATSPKPLAILRADLLEVVDFLSRRVPPGSFLLAHDDVLVPLLALAPTRGDYSSASFAPLPDVLARRRAGELFWAAWNTGGDWEESLKTLNVDLLVVQKGRDRTTSWAAGAAALPTAFENASFVLYRVRGRDR